MGAIRRRVGPAAKSMDPSRKGATLLAMAMAGLAACLAPEASAMPRFFLSQGLVSDSKGNPQTGTILLRFRLWDSMEGGKAIWEESQYVKLTGGTYETVVGRLRPMPSHRLSQGFRLEVEPPEGTGWVVRGVRFNPVGPPSSPASPAPPADVAPAVPIGGETPAPPKDVSGGEIQASAAPPEPGGLAPVASPPRGAPPGAEAAAQPHPWEAADEERPARAWRLGQSPSTAPERQGPAAGPRGTFLPPGRAGISAKPAPPVRSTMYVVKQGDTLMSISNEIYGTPERWMDLYQANFDRIQRGGDVTPGQKLLLP